MRRNLLPQFVLSALALTLAAPVVSFAVVPSRIRSIDSGNPVEVNDNISPRARLSNDLGPAPADRKLENVTLRFSMTPMQQASLSSLLMDQQNPSSPRFHQWLTPEQYGAQFGLSTTDIAKISSWLSSQGLTITSVARSATFVTVSGTVAQVQRAFGTSIHSLSTNGEQHIANVSNPVLPAAIASVVVNITGLNDFKLKPRVQPRTVTASTADPRFTSSISGNHYLAPGDVYTIYDMNPLLSSSINGTGLTIAVVGQTDINIADVAAFRSASLLPANPPTVKLYGSDPGTSSSDLPEAMLDVEWSGAAAPGATILYVNSNDVLSTSLVHAVDDNLAPIISISYGDCESAFQLNNVTSFNQLFQQANAQGQTIIGPGGDSGATDCDFLSTTAVQGLAVDFPASSPFVTGVGGTTFNEGSGTYFGNTNGTYSGSATGYIPEAVWNESSAAGLSAGGGGLSAFFSKPAWQVGNGVPSDFSRDVPDVALDSASSHDGYLYCVNGSCVTGYRASDGQTLTVVGGTSVAAPIVAGMFALVEQKIGSRIGNANPTLYGIANSTYYNNVFHDITVGNNNSPCIAGTPNCPNGGSIGYNAGPGYDLASGWGTLDAFNLANTWKLVTPAGQGSTIGSVLSNTSVTTTSAPCGLSSGSLPLTIKVTNGSTGSASATPTGSVQILVDNVAVGAPQLLANGSLTYTLNTSTLSSGAHTVSATYLGDATFAGSKGSLIQDVVSSTKADFSLTPCIASTSATRGGSSSGVIFTLTPSNSFTGSVTMSATATSIPNNANTAALGYVFSVSPVVINSATAQTTTLTLQAYQTNAKTGNGLYKNGSLSRTGLHLPWSAAGSGAAMAGLLCLLVPRRRRIGSILAVVLTAAAISAAGCSSSSTLASGGGGGTPVTTNATPGLYTVTVTAVASTPAGNVVHSANVTLQVN